MRRSLTAALAALVVLCLAVPAGAQGLAGMGTCTINGFPCWLQPPTAAMDGYALTYSATLRQAVWAAMTVDLGAAYLTGLLPLANLTDSTSTGYPLIAGGAGGDPSYALLPLSSITDDGTAGKVLTSGGAGGDPSWQAIPATTHAMLSATHTDSTAAAVVRGDIITGQGATPAWARLAKGTSGYYLVAGADEVGWSGVLTTDGTSLGSGMTASSNYQLAVTGGANRGGAYIETSKANSLALNLRGVGTAATAPVLVVNNNAAVGAAIRPAIDIRGATGGTGVAGYGLSVATKLRSSDTADREGSALETSWVDATDVSRKAQLAINVYDTAVRSGLTLKATGTQADLYNYGNIVTTSGSAGTRTLGFATEEVTLSTTGLTTDSSANLLPANAVIEAVTARVTTTITNVTDWAVGDASASARFISPHATLTAGTTAVGLNHMQGRVSTDATGPVQTAAAKVRITCTTAGSNPDAGKIRIEVWYRSYGAPGT